jgi:hypothetical protein
MASSVAVKGSTGGLPGEVGAWERIKEALRRDWEQTKFDLALGGHQLNQAIDDTIEQARGAMPLPVAGEANPPRVIATWDEAERAIKFGFEAAGKYGAKYPAWSPTLEARLARDWLLADQPHDWSEVRSFVRHGYTYPHGGLTTPSVPKSE